MVDDHRVGSGAGLLALVEIALGCACLPILAAILWRQFGFGWYVVATASAGAGLASVGASRGLAHHREGLRASLRLAASVCAVIVCISIAVYLLQ